MTTSVSQHVARNARKFGSRVALIGEATCLTYQDLDHAANRLANVLVARGIRPEDKIAILAKSSVSWVVAMVAISTVRAVCVPINYRLTTPEILANLEDADTRLVFTTRDLAEEHLAGRADLPSIVLDPDGRDGFDAVLAAGRDQVSVSGQSDDDLQLIMFTGGTTGRSKGVMLRNRQTFWNTVHEALDTGMTEFDNTVLATPLHHAAALNCWLLPHLYLGGCATIMGSYSADGMIDTIARHGGTNGFMPPSMAREVCLAARSDPSRMRTFRKWYVGGAILSGKDREEMHRLVPDMKIFYQYGLSEAGVIVTVLKEEDYARAPDSIGRPFLNFEVKIADPNTLVDVPAGQEGELWVRGPSVMDGYYKRPDATRDVFHDGWLRTGDAGVMDEGGFVYFRDRIKDMVKTGGLNVYSQEVERVLQRHPKIREVAIVGMPSDKWGEEVTAVVVMRDGETADERELISFSKQDLAHYKAPKRVIFVDYRDMPINYSGKIMKRELRAKLLSGEAR